MPVAISGDSVVSRMISAMNLIQPLVRLELPLMVNPAVFPIAGISQRQITSPWRISEASFIMRHGAPPDLA